jgi:hypothetical protein
MENKKALMYMFGFVLIIAMLGYVSAESSYTFKQGEVIDLKIPVFDDTNAPATNAISCNLNVVSPNQTVIVDSQAMTFNTGGIFSYQIPPMSELGEYSCSMACTNGTVNGFSTFGFDVKNGNIIFLIILLALASLFFISTLVVNEEFFVYISGTLFLISGIYIMINGIDVVSDMYSRAIAYVTIGLGLLFTVGAYIFNTNFKSSEEEEEEY